jgi:hypothetical protein
VEPSNPTLDGIKSAGEEELVVVDVVEEASERSMAEVKGVMVP